VQTISVLGLSTYSPLFGRQVSPASSFCYDGGISAQCRAVYNTSQGQAVCAKGGKMAKRKRTKRPSNKTGSPRCGLCGNTRNLTKTECCGQWICDDEDQYVMFSYARNSCYRNHRRYTLCGYHFAENHTGDWQTCSACENDFETEIYVYFGTNEYNFVKLQNPPAYEPTRCAQCNTIIVLSDDGYSMQGENYFCINCTDLKFPEL
jgi:hypothetical protein